MGEDGDQTYQPLMLHDSISFGFLYDFDTMTITAAALRSGEYDDPSVLARLDNLDVVFEGKVVKSETRTSKAKPERVNRND